MCWNPHLAPDVLQRTPLTHSHVLARSFQNILSFSFFLSAVLPCGSPQEPSLPVTFSPAPRDPGQMSKVTHRPLPHHNQRISSPGHAGPTHPTELISRRAFSVCFCDALCTYFISPSRLNIPPGIREMFGPPRSPSPACANGTGVPGRLAHLSTWPYSQLTWQVHPPLCGWKVRKS